MRAKEEIWNLIHDSRLNYGVSPTLLFVSPELVHKLEEECYDSLPRNIQGPMAMVYGVPIWVSHLMKYLYGKHCLPYYDEWPLGDGFIKDKLPNWLPTAEEKEALRDY